MENTEQNTDGGECSSPESIPPPTPHNLMTPSEIAKEFFITPWTASGRSETSRCARKAFSLLEMLIVLTTMAVLAGMALTHFQESTLDAKRSVLIHNWHVYRAQIQLYHLTHLGRYPELRNGQLPQLFQPTNQYGQIGLPGPAYPYGPYLDAPPINPYTMSDTVVQVEKPGQKPTRPVGNAAWQYDPLTGDIWPNHPEFFQDRTLKKVTLSSPSTPSALRSLPLKQ